MDWLAWFHKRSAAHWQQDAGDEVTALSTTSEPMRSRERERDGWRDRSALVLLSAQFWGGWWGLGTGGLGRYLPSAGCLP